MMLAKEGVLLRRSVYLWAKPSPSEGSGGRWFDAGVFGGGEAVEGATGRRKKGANQCFWIAAANTFALRWTQRENDRTKTAYYVCRSPFLAAPQHRSFPGRENTHVADSTISIFIIYYLGDYKCTHIIIIYVLYFDVHNKI